MVLGAEADQCFDGLAQKLSCALDAVWGISGTSRAICGRQEEAAEDCERGIEGWKQWGVMCVSV